MFYGFGFSQTYSPEVWHNGQVILKTGDTLRGRVKYSFSEEVVQLHTPIKLKVFTPANLFEVDFTDSISNENRTIKTFRYESSENYYMPLYFEEIITGEIGLLSRDFIEFYTTGGTFNDGFLSTSKQHASYYYYKKGLLIKPLPARKKKFFALFNGSEDEIRRFCKMNGLGISRSDHLKQIFTYYNTL